MTISALQKARNSYQPKLPSLLRNAVRLCDGDSTQSVADQVAVKEMFPKTFGMPTVTFEKGDASSFSAINVGVILSGGQAPGGHNVIAGLFDGLKAMNSDSRLFGFLGGPSGLVDNRYIEITADFLEGYRNTGGFDIIGSGRTKLEETSQFDKVADNCQALNVTALVIIGGDDSNTNACVLAEYYLEKETGIQVIGCPKTIDGDLKSEMIETSFGFDTACKVYSELIGNIMRDCNSSKKYWHFVRLMGRSASHITLECALQTQPNICLIGEEVRQKGLSLNDIVDDMVNVIVKRADNEENFGVALIPEGIVEFIPEVGVLIAELNELLHHHEAKFNTIEDKAGKVAFVQDNLSAETAAVYASLPELIQIQLTNDRDPHGNVQVSLIETEKLLIEMVAVKLKAMKEAGTYKGKFGHQAHFFGYEGRCASPSNFDADYCYSLGYTAAVLIGAGKTGYMSCVRNLIAPAAEWIAGGVPITMMLNMERRHGADKPVIQKALVELDAAPFKYYTENRQAWSVNTDFIYPGPIQYFGPTEVCDQCSKTIALEWK